METVFSVWSVLWLYTEIPRITEAVESEWELADQSSVKRMGMQWHPAVEEELEVGL
jgi:hypothetical protein